jgi:hypothetical protein
LQKARGEYFRWAAHDDIFAPDLLRQCVEALDRDAKLLLCFSAIIEINERGERKEGIQRLPEIPRTPLERFRFLSSRNKHWCEPIYGLMRTEVLRKTGLLGNYTDSDRVLLCELGFYGSFHQIPEPLFYKRVHPGNYYRSWRGRMAWFTPDLARTGRVTLPNWILFSDYFAMLQRVPLTPQERAACWLWMVGPWLVVGRGKGMVKDLVSAAYMSALPKSLRQKWYDPSNWA